MRSFARLVCAQSIKEISLRKQVSKHEILLIGTTLGAYYLENKDFFDMFY